MSAQSGDTIFIQSPRKLSPGTLRRVKILADFGDDQLERFASFMPVESVKQWTELVRFCLPGDSMYLILEGEFRVRVLVNGKETILADLGVGDCFGEMALFDDSPRSADVIANTDATVLKISRQALAKLMNEAPDIAAPFLLALGKTLASRIRANNKRLKDDVARARSGGY
jgi:CRP/FNR family cyclic AMP-dependent transcriptional regulator